MKSKLNKLDVDKLVLISFDLSKLSDVVKNDVVKKTGYDELAKNVHAIDTSAFVKQADYDCKINETKGQISNINGLATTATLNNVKNKIPNISDLVKKQIMMQK